MDDPKLKRPWSPWQYIILAIVAMLIAVFILRPLGQGVTNPFKAITNALSGQQR